MTAAPITVYLFDDDASVRRALVRLIRAAGMRAESFETVSRLVNMRQFAERACVVADICLPETSGLELPVLLARQGRGLPVIFITAQDTEKNRAAARRAGAICLFRKPVVGQALIDAIAWAIEAASDVLSFKPEPIPTTPKRGDVK